MSIPATTPRTTADRIRDLIEREQLTAARDLLAAALEAGDHDPALEAWQTVLAPARVVERRDRALEPSRDRELAWLDAHAREHRGQWLALDGDQLVAQASTLQELHTALPKMTPPPLVVRCDA